MSDGRQTGDTGLYGSPQLPDEVNRRTNLTGGCHSLQGLESPQQGNTYGPVNMTGGNLHQGDRYYLDAEDIARKEAERFIESLRFPEINLRVNQITESHHKTFQWALNSVSSSKQQPEVDSRTPPAHSGAFGAWLTTDEPVFWVAGKPGSGKSTLMKFVSSHNRTSALLRRKFQSKEVLVLRYFFWLHGSEMQRTIKGCLSALLYQLLCRDYGLVTTILQKDANWRSKYLLNDWSESELRRVLFDTLNSGFRAYGIFLDGLDEHDKQLDVRELLDLVQDFSMLRNVKLCVSSRQENSFERAFLHKPKLRLQDLTSGDMRAIAQARLEIEWEQSEPSLTRSQLNHLAEKVASRAEGVFLWAIVAIRVTTESIRNCDNYETLLAGLQGLPSEVEELCQRLLAKVNGSGKKAWETSFRYFTVAKYQPISLLTFTLATDEQALRRVTKISTSLTTTDMERLLQACNRTELRIRAHTAGLLEVVPDDYLTRRGVEFDNDDNAKVADQGSLISERSSHKYPLCSCLDPRRLPRCFSSLPFVEGFYQIHCKRVQYMHRDVAGVLESMDIPGLAAARAMEVLLEPLKRFFIAMVLEQDLGCFCNLQYVPKKLCSVLAELGPIHAPAVVNQVTDGVTVRAPRSGRQACYYGLTHQIFMRNTSDYIPNNRYIHRADRIAYDFQGLLARLGLSPSDTTKMEVSSWSSYYKGYLLACAVKGEYDHHPECQKQYLGRSHLVSWLLRHGADLLSPQLSCSQFGEFADRVFPPDYDLVLRSPIVDCWCFILRLLDESQVSREEKLQICSILVPKFLAQKCCPSDMTVWSVRVAISMARPNDILPDMSDVCKIQFLMKTSVQKLQAYTLSAIWHLQEGHQQGRQVPSFSAADVCLLFWNLPERSRSHQLPDSRSKEPHRGYVKTVSSSCLQVDVVRNESFNTILGAALRAIFCREGTTPQSTKLLVGELRKFSGQGLPQPEAMLTRKTEFYLDWIFRSQIIKRLCEPFDHSFYMLPGWRRACKDICVVPPEMTLELGKGQWYEHGALREWHERRRRKMWSTPPEWQQHIDMFETTNQDIRPSYLPPVTDLGGAGEASSLFTEQHDTTNSDTSLGIHLTENTTGQKRKLSDAGQDDPQNLAHSSSNKRQRPIDKETLNIAEDTPHCSPSGRILRDPHEMTTEIDSRVGADLGLDWSLTSVIHQQTNLYNRFWE